MDHFLPWQEQPWRDPVLPPDTVQVVGVPTGAVGRLSLLTAAASIRTGSSIRIPGQSTAGRAPWSTK